MRSGCGRERSCRGKLGIVSQENCVTLFSLLGRVTKITLGFGLKLCGHEMFQWPVSYLCQYDALFLSLS